MHPSVKTPVKKEVDPSVIHLHDSVSNVTPGEGETPAGRHSWGERPKHKRALECSMEATKHIEGKRLETFVEVDPSVSEIREFERLESTKQWEKLRDQFIKYASLNREIMWEGKPDVTALTEWKSATTHFFVTQPVLNPVAQASLATFAFRNVARKWWASKMKLYPRLVLTFDQLVEWVKKELTPGASPAKAAHAWAQLSYRGDTSDYVKQLEKLILAFPVDDREQLLLYVASPLGSEFESRISQADQCWGENGMTWKKLIKFVEYHLEGLPKGERNTLVEKNAHRIGFGVKRPNRSQGLGKEKVSTHAVAVESDKAVTTREERGALREPRCVPRDRRPPQHLPDRVATRNNIRDDRRSRTSHGFTGANVEPFPYVERAQVGT